MPASTAFCDEPSRRDEHRRILLEACRREGLTTPQTAYVIATAHHESRLGLWMEDLTDGWRYEARDDLGNVETGDGHRYRPRGYARLNGRTHYGRWAGYLDLPLLDEPGLAARPKVAAKILVQGMKLGRFTGRRLSHYIDDARLDYVGARQVMAVATLPVEVAVLARRYEAHLEGIAAVEPTRGEVRLVQRQLRIIGWPVAVDGMLGSITRRAIRDFQAGYTFTELPTHGHPDPATRQAIAVCAANGGRASEHFRFAEFRTAGSRELSETNRVIRVERSLVQALERYRAHLGEPVQIADGYRSVDYNDRINARANSEHVAGRAVHVDRARLTAGSVMALGSFSSIGLIDGLAVHLGVAPGEPTPNPRVYALA